LIFCIQLYVLLMINIWLFFIDGMCARLLMLAVIGSNNL